MFFLGLTSLVSFTFFPSIYGSPSPIFGLGQKHSSSQTVVVSSSTIQNEFIRPAFFTAMAYCPTSNILAQNCGLFCDKLKGIEILTAGGDDGEIPDFYVAFDPTTNAIVVAHRGTNPKNFLSDLNDVQFVLVNINKENFPNAPGSVKVHDGFQETFERTADTILSTVSSGLRLKQANKVTVVGHSLGAAIAIMDAVHLRGALDSSIQISTTVFGLPRGGNQDWANFVDAQLGNTLVHITNKNDPVPTVPPQFFDFQHPSGEVHINTDNSVVSCPGQENEHCSDSDNIFNASVSDHFGPYFLDIIHMGGSPCPGS